METSEFSLRPEDEGLMEKILAAERAVMLFTLHTGKGVDPTLVRTLSPRLPERLLPHALELAIRTKDYPGRIEVLKALESRRSGRENQPPASPDTTGDKQPEDRAFIKEAIRSVSTDPNHPYRIAEQVQHIPEVERPNIINKMLRVTENKRTALWIVQALAVFKGWFTEEQRLKLLAEAATFFRHDAGLSQLSRLYTKLGSPKNAAWKKQILKEIPRLLRTIKFVDFQYYTYNLGIFVTLSPDEIFQDATEIDPSLDYPELRHQPGAEKEPYLNSVWLQSELAQIIDSALPMSGGGYERYLTSQLLMGLSPFLSGLLLRKIIGYARKISEKDLRADGLSAVLASLARLQRLPRGLKREKILREAFLEAFLTSTGKGKAGFIEPLRIKPRRPVMGEIRESMKAPREAERRPAFPARPFYAPRSSPQFKMAAEQARLRQARLEAEAARRAKYVMMARQPAEKALRKETTPPRHLASKRYVNTAFTAQSQPEKVIQKNMPLASGGRYYFCLWVGEPAEESIEVTRDVIPASIPSGALLKVAVFGFENEMEIRPGADVGEIQLQPDGTAKVTRQPAKEFHPPLPANRIEERMFFPVAAPARTGEFRLRCNIYYQQILVRSRIVYAKVMEHPEPVKGAQRSEIDYTLSRTLSPAHLNRLGPHKLSLMLNSNDGITHALIFAREGEDEFKSMASIDGLEHNIKRVREILNVISWGDTKPWQKQDYLYQDRKLDMNRLKEDLENLAVYGYKLYDAIIENFTENRDNSGILKKLMRYPGSVQIAMKMNSTNILPASVFYDYNFDTQFGNKHPVLCDAFIASLHGEKPLEETDCFQGRCPNYDKPDHICPSGFWGYRHVLGVPISTGTKNDENGSDIVPEINARELLNIVAGVATNLKEEKEHIKNVKTFCDERGWHFSARRDEILTLLKEKQPHIVYFYCHGAMKEKELILQVGDSGEYIDGSNLRSYGILWKNTHPLVFINGCETAALFPDNAIRLVNSFIRTGSSGVIGTEITIFESLASDFAEECLRLFITEELSIGEAIRRTRLMLLKQGNPLGLVYTPFVIPSLCLKTK